MDKWDVRLISSQTQQFPYAGGQSSPVGMSQLVSSMLETVQAMHCGGIPAYEVGFPNLTRIILYINDSFYRQYSAWLIWSPSCRRSICNRKRWPHFCWKPIPADCRTSQRHCSSRRTMCRCCCPSRIYIRRRSVVSAASALDDRWRSHGAAAGAAKREEETRKQEQQQDQSSLPIIKGRREGRRITHHHLTHHPKAKRNKQILQRIFISLIL